MSNPALGTSLYYGQFALSLGIENPDIFSKFNWPNNMDTPLKQTHSMATLVSGINVV